MESTIFHNHSLNRSRPTIRLIEILPESGENDDLIACTFQAFDLVECPPYVALSYTWGPATTLPMTTSNRTATWKRAARLSLVLRDLHHKLNTHVASAGSQASNTNEQPLYTVKPTFTIMVDGMPFMVRKNLYLALQAIRYKMKTDHQIGWRLFWIDALCINQEDVNERNHQVNLMSQIYSQARLVLVWLGPEADDSHLALSYVKNRPTNTTSTERDYFTAQLSVRRIYEAVLAFYHRPYWSRLWIQQELVLASDILVLCGVETCDWEGLEYTANLCLTGLQSKIHAAPGNITIRRRSIWHNSTGHAKTLDWVFQFWGSLADLHCGDSRDRIFGLLGLIEKSARGTLGLLEADYRQSRADILFRILLFMKDNPAFARCQAKTIMEKLVVMLELDFNDPSLASWVEVLGTFPF
jgi:hypothetical protein